MYIYIERETHIISYILGHFRCDFSWILPYSFIVRMPKQMKDQVTDLYRKDYVPTMYTDMVWYAVSEYEGCVEKF